MRLPDRLDYAKQEPDEPDGEWHPVVDCTVPGCRWEFHAPWGDLAEDGDIDWDVEHPPHLAECEGWGGANA